jgi:predicted nucleotidyltransferase
MTPVTDEVLKKAALTLGKVRGVTKVYQREQILKSLQKDQAALRRMGVRRIGLFGSVVRGEAQEDSDLDFVVELERVSFDGYMDLKFHLEDRFRKKVDLVLSHMIKPALRRRIHGEMIYVPGF